MRLLFILALSLTAMTAQAQTYRWVDSNGKVQITDTPPPGRLKNVATSGDKPVADDGQSFALKKAAADFPVTLYSASNCGDPCQRGRELLSSRGIPFTDKTLQSQAEADELKALVGETFVPTLKVGKQSLRGFDASAWQNLLDLAGYPKNAGKPGARP